MVLKAVPSWATVVGIPAMEVGQQPAKTSEFCAYGSSGDMPDPIARALDSLCSDIVGLRRRVAELEETMAATRDSAGEGERAAMPLAVGERARLVAIKGDEL